MPRLERPRGDELLAHFLERLLLARKRSLRAIADRDRDSGEIPDQLAHPFRYERERVVGALPRVAQREVLLNHPGTEHVSDDRHRNPVLMVGETDDDLRVALAVGGDHAQVELLDAYRICGGALEHAKLLVERQDRLDRSIHILDRCPARGDDHRLPEPGQVTQERRVAQVARRDLVGWHVKLGEELRARDVEGGREERDAELPGDRLQLDEGVTVELKGFAVLAVRRTEAVFVVVGHVELRPRVERPVITLLQLYGIRTALCCGPDERLRRREVTLVVVADLGDHIRRRLVTDLPAIDRQLAQLFSSDSRPTPGPQRWYPDQLDPSARVMQSAVQSVVQSKGAAAAASGDVVGRRQTVVMPLCLPRVLGTAASAIAAFFLLSTVSSALGDVTTFVLWRLTLPRAFLFLAAVALVVFLAALRGVQWRLSLPYHLSARAASLVLGLIVGGAAATWRSVNSAATLPGVFGDELIFADLAKSVSRGDGLLLRGVENFGYGPGYPLFAAPFYALTGNGVAAYEALQAGQAIVMASAAIPVYLLARRAMNREAALLCAALAVAAPAMVYTSLVMTEALFYPVLLWFCVGAARALDRPTLARQAMAIALLILAASIRLQAVAAIAALVTAVLIRAAMRGRRRELRQWAPTLALFSVAGLVWLTVVLTTDLAPLGAYSVLTDAPNLGSAILWSARSLGALSLAVGFVAMVVFAPAAVRLLRGSPAEASLGALAISMVLWIVIEVGYLSATPFGLDRVHERNLIVLVPLVIVCAMAWTTHGLPCPFASTALGVIVTVACVASLRHEDLVRQTDIDALSIVPWRVLDGQLLSVERIAVAAALVGAAVVVFTRRAWVVPLTLIVTLAVAAYVPTPTVGRQTTRALSWVDDEVGRDADVLVVTAGIANDRCDTKPLDQLATWTEFFNVSAGEAAYVFQDNTYSSLASDRLTIAADGTLERSGSPVEAEAVVVDERVVLMGERLATLRVSSFGGLYAADTGGLSLWRVDRPARVANVRTLRTLRSLVHRKACP
jgi:Dolichyl-phosphate-mannose-protein mannosyltransferase